MGGSSCQPSDLKGSRPKPQKNNRRWRLRQRTSSPIKIGLKKILYYEANKVVNEFPEHSSFRRSNILSNRLNRRRIHAVVMVMQKNTVDDHFFVQTEHFIVDTSSKTLHADEKEKVLIKEIPDKEYRGVVFGDSIFSPPPDFDFKNIDDFLKRTRRDLEWLDICFRYYAIRPFYRHGEIIKILHNMLYYISRCGLDVHFVSLVNNRIGNDISSLCRVFETSGMGLTNLKRDLCDSLTRNFEKLDKEISAGNFNLYTEIQKIKFARDQLRAIQHEIKYIKICFEYYKMNCLSETREQTLSLIETKEFMVRQIEKHTKIIEHISHLGFNDVQKHLEDFILNKTTSIAAYLRIHKNKTDRGLSLKKNYLGIIEHEMSWLDSRMDEIALYLKELDSETRKKRRDKTK